MFWIIVAMIILILAAKFLQKPQDTGMDIKTMYCKDCGSVPVCMSMFDGLCFRCDCGEQLTIEKQKGGLLS